MRLTNTHRDAIKNALLERKFGVARKKLEERSRDLALLAFYRIFDPKVCKQLRDIPDGWLPTTTRVRLRITSNGDEGYNHTLQDLTLSVPLPVPYCDQHLELVVEATDDLAVAAIALDKDEDALATARQTMRNKITGALDAYSTKKQLLTGWPEVAKVAERYLHEPAKSGQYLVPVTPELNVELELP